MSNKLVCFDSTIFNNVFRDDPPVEAEKLIQYLDSNKLYRALSSSDYKVLVPTVVLTEAACFMNDIDRNRFFTSVPTAGFIIGEFNLSTSMLLSKILYDRYNDTQTDYTEFVVKRKMKYDSLILAIAEENACDCFYTLDADFRRYKTSVPILGLHDRPPSYDGGTPFDELLREIGEIQS